MSTREQRVQPRWSYAVYAATERELTVMTLLNAPGCRPEFHLRHSNLS